MNIFTRSDDVLSGEGFQLRYDMIILDESESLLAHFDEQIMSGRRSASGNFFDELLNHSGKMLLMDGDINNNNTGAPRTINLMLDEQQWQT